MLTILKGARIANTMGRWRKSGPDNFYLANRPKPRKKNEFTKRKKHNKRRKRRKKNHIQKEEMNEINKNKYLTILTLEIE